MARTFERETEPVYWQDFDTDGDFALNPTEYDAFIAAGGADSTNIPRTTSTDTSTDTDVSDDTYVPPEQTVEEVEELVSGLSESNVDVLLEGMEAADRMVSGGETSTDWFYDLSPVAQAVAIYVASGGNVNLQSAASDSTFVDMNGTEYQPRGAQDALATLLGPFLDPLANISNNPLGALAQNRSRNATARAELRDKRQFINRLVDEEGYTREQARHIYYDYLGARDENPNKTLSDAQIDQLYSDYQAGNTPSAVAAQEEAARIAEEEAERQRLAEEEAAAEAERQRLAEEEAAAEAERQRLAEEEAAAEAERQRLAEEEAAAEAERQRLAEEAAAEAERQRLAEEEAAAEAERQRLAALDNAENIFNTAGYNPSPEEVEAFADNPDGIADYIDPRQVTTEEARQSLNDAGIPNSVLDGEFAERWATVIGAATGQGDENFQSTVNTNLGYYADKRIVTEEEAAEYFRDLGYEPSPEEIADFVGVIDDPMRTDNYDTRNNVGDYVDPRQITREELEAIAAEQGYTLDEDDYKKYVGQSDNTSEIEGRLIDAELDFDANSVTAEELASIAADEGYTLSAEEAQSLVGNRNERELQEQLDAGAVTEQELKDIAEAQNYDLGNLSEEEYATLVGNVTEADVINNIDSRAVTIAEVIEIYEDQIGETIDEEAAKQLLASAGYVIDDATGDVVPGSLNEETFKEYVGGVERSLGETLSRLGQNVLDLIFGKDPATGGSKSIQQIIEEQLELALPPSPSDPDYMRKYVEWLKRQSGSIISINHDPTQGIFAGVRFPVPIPISGPEITIPLFDENGNYIGGNVGQIFLNEVGDIITETGERVGQLAEDGLQILNDAGEVIRSIPLVQIGTDENGNPEFGVEGWEEGDPNPFDLDQNDDGQIDDPGLPVVEDPDRDGDTYPNEEDAFPDDPDEWLDTDSDGVGDNADAFPEDASETLDTDGDGVGDNSDLFPEDASESVDTDGDGVGDNADAFPENADETLDTDGDGVGDNSDLFPENADETLDTDGDGVGDNSDLFPEDASETLDTDGDGVGDNADVFPEDASETVDTDADGVGDNADAFPDDANENLDTDGDGVGDNSDSFPTNPDETVDTDGDGVGDNTDQYPDDDRVTGLEDFATQQDVEDAKQDVLDTLYDELGELGLSIDEINTVLEEVKTELDGVATTEDLENLKEDINQTITEELSDLGIDNIQDTLDAVGEDIDDLSTSLSEVQEDVSDLADDIDNLDGRVDDLVDQGIEQTDALNQAIEELSDKYDLTTNEILDAISESESNLSTQIGLPARADDPDTEEDESRPATGLYAEIAASEATITGDISDLADLVSQYEEAGLSRDEALATAISDLSDQLGTTEETFLASLGETEETVLDAIAASEATITADISDLTDLVMAYEAEGLSRDEALATAISDLSDQLGTTEENFLTSLGETEETVLDAIAASEATITGDISDLTDLVMAYEADGIARDEAITLAVNDLSEDLGLTRDELLLRIGESETTIMDAIDTSQMETNQYLDYISSVIGRPASDLTQDDVDMVVNLLAEDEFISDFNNDLRLYDVNFDGQIDQSDIGLLQGFVDAGVEGIGEIPATGIYADAARRQEEITGSIADQAGETRELIGTEAEETRRIVGQQNLFNALLGSGDLMGRQVDVTTPDPVQLKYVYDFSDIFATPQQRGLFPSPYGAPQRQAAQRVAQQRGIMSGPLNLGGLQGRPGMAAGGKVDYDFTDEIMHIMSYGDS